MRSIADTWVHYDDVRISRRSWQVRNRIRTATGWRWLTVPVLGSGTQLIQDVMLPDDDRWQHTHRVAVESAYGSAPGGGLVLSLLDEVFAVRPRRLVDLTVPLLERLCALLGAAPPGQRVLRSSELGIAGTGSRRIVEHCVRLGAQTYVTGPSALDYLDLAAFKAAGVSVEIFTWTPPGPEPGNPLLSVIDLIAVSGLPSASRAVTDGIQLRAGSVSHH